MAAPLLSMRGIIKRFGAVAANDGIDLEVGPGRIVGLLGENGSGKSTLMRVLFGMTRPDAGGIVFKGRELSDHTPAIAMRAGIAMIHQHLTLVDAATVLENVMLGWSDAGRILRRRAIASRIREASESLGLDLDPASRVADLPLGRRQRVEILKAVLRGADLLILDEPTSNLAPPEVEGVLGVLRRLRDGGKGVVFISHKLTEVMAVCDEIVVLRAGRVASRTAVAGASREGLAAAMIGQDLAPRPTRQVRGAGDTARVRLRAAALHGPGLQPIDLDLVGGEVLGLAGVDGNGQIELVELLAGMRRAASGSLLLDGHDITRRSVVARTASGLATMPADRSRTSLVRTMSVADNLHLRRRAVRPDTRATMRRFDIRAAGPNVPAGRLSGGNQQKIVVAREIGAEPAVLVAHQATSGLDPAATGFVLDRIRDLRDRGAAVLYVSSELEEILAVADRVGVMFEGRIIGPVARSRADPVRLGLAMSSGRDL